MTEEEPDDDEAQRLLNLMREKGDWAPYGNKTVCTSTLTVYFVIC